MLRDALMPLPTARFRHHYATPPAAPCYPRQIAAADATLLLRRCFHKDGVDIAADEGSAIYAIARRARSARYRRCHSDASEMLPRLKRIYRQRRADYLPSTCRHRSTRLPTPPSTCSCSPQRAVRGFLSQPRPRARADAAKK